jgi:ABC-2 type transport system permease protein
MRGQMQHRMSFAMKALGHFFVTGAEFLGYAALFQRFGQIRGWELSHMALFYGIISIAFATAEGAARGFDIFPRLIKAGEFDRLLVRPRPTELQVLGQEFELLRVGRWLQGLFVLLWAMWQLELYWSAAQVTLVVLSIAGGACLFSGLLILQATLCFWTTESLEILNCTTYGGVEAAQFPVTIYRPWFRLFFTFVIPLATINYFPAHAILGLDDPLGSTRAMQWLAPLAGVIFLLVCLRFWHVGERRYTSTGS